MIPARPVLYRHQYFVPDGAPWPDHAPYQRRLSARVVTDAGPQPGEGLVVPGPLDAGRGDWRRSQAGWWVRDLPRDPGGLMRVSCTGVGCRTVRTDRGDWVVRVVLNPDGTTALPMPWGVLGDGSYGLLIAAEHRDLVEHARAYRRDLAGIIDGDDVDGMMTYAARFLYDTYHVSIHELALGAYLTQLDALRICEAATGTEAEALRALAADLGLPS